jgi:hypothetical protein
MSNVRFVGSSDYKGYFDNNVKIDYKHLRMWTHKAVSQVSNEAITVFDNCILPMAEIENVSKKSDWIGLSLVHIGQKDKQDLDRTSLLIFPWNSQPGRSKHDFNEVVIPTDLNRRIVFEGGLKFENINLAYTSAFNLNFSKATVFSENTLSDNFEDHLNQFLFPDMFSNVININKPSRNILGRLVRKIKSKYIDVFYNQQYYFKNTPGFIAYFKVDFFRDFYLKNNSFDQLACFPIIMKSEGKVDGNFPEGEYFSLLLAPVKKEGDGYFLANEYHNKLLIAGYRYPRPWIPPQYVFDMKTKKTFN